MPSINSPIHIDMFRKGQHRRSLRQRAYKAWRTLLGEGDVYGLEWGDPDSWPPLRHVRDHFLLPFLSRTTVVLEIGPGGGRWTRYMLNAKHIYAVDLHQEILDELHRNFGKNRNITYIKNHGDDFPGIECNSVDFVFSFGTFVHLEQDVIGRYLDNLKPLLHSTSHVIIQYADKSKPLGRQNPGFSENDPPQMRALALKRGYSILEEDTATLWHSAVIRLGLPG